MMAITTLIVIIILFAVIIVPDRRTATMLILLVAIAKRPLLSCRYADYYQFACVYVIAMLGTCARSTILIRQYLY